MFDGRDPIYLQIADQVRRDVLSGAIREGEQVMSTTQYATTYRINPATAAKAFAILVDEGVLYKQRGVGMFVAAGAAEQLRREHRADYFKAVLQPALDQAAALGITPDEIVEHIRSAAEGARS
jgi:DNA-binding transcriptional regulator YhcF (GntR family)